MLPSGDWIDDYTSLTKNAYSLQGLENFDEIMDNFDLVQHNIESLLKVIEWSDPSELHLLFDFGETVKLPANCQLRQIAIYNDKEKTLQIAKDLWEQLDSINKAALIQHELYYFCLLYTSDAADE